MPVSDWLPSGKTTRRIARAILSVLIGALIVAAIAIFLASFLPFCPIGEIPKQQSVNTAGTQECTAAAIFFFCRGLQIAADIRSYIFENLIPISAALGAGATIAIAWFTATLKNSTDRLWEAGEKQLAASQRPWIAISAALTSGVTYDPDGSLRVSFGYDLENVGNAPALKLRVVTELIAAFGDTRQQHMALVERVRKRKLGQDTIGYTVFQRHPIKTVEGQVISKAAIDEFNGWWNKSFSPPVPATNILPTLIGCVVYQSPLQQVNHVTAFICDIRRKDPAIPIADLDFEPAQGNVPISNLSLIWREWGSFAD